MRRIALLAMLSMPLHAATTATVCGDAPTTTVRGAPLALSDLSACTAYLAGKPVGMKSPAVRMCHTQPIPVGACIARSDWSMTCTDTAGRESAASRVVSDVVACNTPAPPATSALLPISA